MLKKSSISLRQATGQSRGPQFGTVVCQTCAMPFSPAFWLFGPRSTWGHADKTLLPLLPLAKTRVTSNMEGEQCDCYHVLIKVFRELFLVTLSASFV